MEGKLRPDKRARRKQYLANPQLLPRKCPRLTQAAAYCTDTQGFIPVVLRAFPTNAAALAVWETTMRWATK